MEISTFDICLIGNPGVVESIFLKYVGSIAPQGVYTTGKGSCDVGLIAAITKDVSQLLESWCWRAERWYWRIGVFVPLMSLTSEFISCCIAFSMYMTTRCAPLLPLASNCPPMT